MQTYKSSSSDNNQTPLEKRQSTQRLHNQSLMIKSKQCKNTNGDKQQIRHQVRLITEC